METTDHLHQHPQRKKKRLPRLEQGLVHIKNPDKVGAEGPWTPERGRNLANFPSPARIVLIGPCGVGKTNLIKLLVLHQRPRFERVILIHEDAGRTREYKDLECTEE